MSNNRYAWLAQDEFSASDVLGGARGIAEAVVPGLVFLGFYVLSGALLLSAIASALCSVLFAIIRLIQRQSIVQSLSGLLGVGIALVWALVSGKGINFFTWGIVTNAAWALVLLVSLVIGWPLVSVLFGLLTGPSHSLGERARSARSRSKMRVADLGMVCSLYHSLGCSSAPVAERTSRVAFSNEDRVGNPAFYSCCLADLVALKG